jgi:phosphotransferase system HPr-like phosphotransfer protein
MIILMLAARKNSQLIVTVEGDDAEMAMRVIVRAFEEQFGEK